MLRRKEARLSGWGRLSVPGREVRSEDLLCVTARAVLTRGLGRSYGDSALPPPGVTEVAGSALADRILAFDSVTGLLLAEAGLSLAELNRLLLPRGWFVPVSPGTQFVTLGGMVAADVHGKNHHRDGTIGRHVTRLLVRLASGEVVECSRQDEPELFRATIGGMGLTGHVLEVELRMVRIPSPWILAESFPVPDVAAFVRALKASGRDWPFTVGWIDCLHRGGRRSGLGRGVLHRGRWALPEEASRAGRAGPPPARRRLAVPFVLPGWLLNPSSVRAFNALYFHRYRGASAERPRRGVVHPESFFYPLDALRDWNRLYGPRGFTQYQCVLPEEAEGGPAAAAERFLDLLSRSRAASFLCVIKDCGPEGEGVLSFPRPGISIAVDLPVRDGTQELVDALDRQVIAEGGRIYLAKDAFTRREHFQAMEGDRLADFARLRAKYDPEGRLASAQSVRLLGDPRTRWEPRRSARDLPAAS
jgi:FAD/FMN-containing dehydrogenase